MTTLLEDAPPAESMPVPAPAAAVAPGPAAPPRPATPSQLRRLFGYWMLAMVGGMALVPYGLGPLFHQREQRALMGSYRAAVDRAANESTGFGGVTVPVVAPAPGEPVAIIEIGSLKLQLVVVEGVGASQTRNGPGHVPGSGGLGQPGNSVVVGRRAAFGGDFSRLHSVKRGDQIVVTTTQGQSVYAVDDVRRASIGSPSGGGAPTGDLYGPSADDRLTLITAASPVPWRSQDAQVVVAKLQTVAFPPTPQGGRLAGATGATGDDGAVAAVALAALAYGVVMGGSVLLYRTLSLRAAYLVSVGPIIALTIVNAETLARLFPAWL